MIIIACDKFSEGTIKRWLENYQEMVSASKYNSRYSNWLPGNSGPKPQDGISNRQITKIMLKAAVKDLPPILKRCMYARWINPLPLGETLRKLGMTQTVYYKRCMWVVEFITYHINGDDHQKNQLLSRVNRILKEND